MDACQVMLHGHTDTIRLLAVHLEPPTIDANATVTQTYTAPPARVGDFVVVTALASFSGTCIVGAFIPEDGRVEVTWLNTDNQTATPAPRPGLLLFLRDPFVGFTVPGIFHH